MKFYRYLYLGESIEKKKRVVWKLKHRKVQMNVYVIAFPLYGDALLEIYHANVLLQDFYKRNPLFVVGIAGSEDEAYKLVATIVQDVYDNTKDVNIRDFIRQRQLKKGRNLVTCF